LSCRRREPALFRTSCGMSTELVRGGKAPAAEVELVRGGKCLGCRGRARLRRERLGLRGPSSSETETGWPPWPELVRGRNGRIPVFGALAFSDCLDDVSCWCYGDFRYPTVAPERMGEAGPPPGAALVFSRPYVSGRVRASAPAGCSPRGSVRACCSRGGFNIVLTPPVRKGWGARARP
jgi:hypothetical protein